MNKQSFHVYKKKNSKVKWLNRFRILVLRYIEYNNTLPRNTIFDAFHFYVIFYVRPITKKPTYVIIYKGQNNMTWTFYRYQITFNEFCLLLNINNNEALL